MGFVASSDLKDLVASVKCFKLVKDGGSVSDFVAATTQVRRTATPRAARLLGKPDEVKCLSAEECQRRFKESKLLAVRGQDVFIVAALHAADGASTNDLLIQLLFFIATCRDHGARRITAVVPWLPYARKDRVTKARDPVSSRYVAQLFDAVGTDAVVTVDVHNPAAFQNGFRCQTVHLQSTRLFATEIAARAGEGELAPA